MNKGKGEWWDWTWNPVTGCTKGCDYCYARQWWHRFHEAKHGAFTPRVWRERYSEPCGKKTSAVIFTVSMGDLFDPALCNGDRDEVMCMIQECDRHEYVVLTKNEEGLKRYAKYLEAHGEPWPENLWIGVSITRARDLPRINALCGAVPAGQRVVCFEPLLEPIAPALAGIDWVIIGGMTGRQKFLPPAEWINNITHEAYRSRASIWIKANAGADYPQVWQKLPEVMRGRLLVNKIKER